MVRLRWSLTFRGDWQNRTVLPQRGATTSDTGNQQTAIALRGAMVECVRALGRPLTRRDGAANGFDERGERPALRVVPARRDCHGLVDFSTSAVAPVVGSHLPA